MKRRRIRSAVVLSGLICLLILLQPSCTGRARTPDFTIVVLPDTQFYSASLHGGTPEMFRAQTRWIVENRRALNIAFVTQLGDLVEHGDEFPEEWDVADSAISLLEDPDTTGLPDGIPYGIAVGNHDQTPQGDPDGTTDSYNRLCGESRFRGRAYYGGHYGTNNDNHYELFRVGSAGFVVVHLEYDESPDRAVLDWADHVLEQHADRLAIVVTHFLLLSGDPAPFGDQGRAIYDALKGNPNLFLMLGGHIPTPTGEGRRTDTFEGRRVYSLLSDYQSRENGGNGLLRILQFRPAAGRILVRTFSPYANGGQGAYEQDEDSEFELPYAPGG